MILKDAHFKIIKCIWRIMSVLFILLHFFNIISVNAADSSVPTRTINVVYDDSGSMIKSSGQYVDTWCQAKYAMEVFGAMLGDSDMMNIYYMSDFDFGSDAGPQLVLYGSDGAQANVKKIHESISEAGNTPFNAVRKAYSDLTRAESNEKWLVILTDGAFEDGKMSQAEIDGFFAAKYPDIRVMFLGMGPDAGEIAASEDQHIYCIKAQNNREILRKVTEICTRIFNSNRLEVNASRQISFDVPMSELVVFAQGENVSIDSISALSGRTYKTSILPVNVKYSEVASLNAKGWYNPSEYKVAPELKGQIATFRDDFDAGEYKLEISGANTIEVYYKPNVEIAAYLTNNDGDEVTDLSDLKAGEYTITFGFVKEGTSEKVNQSMLLGDVSFSGTVFNNGVKHDREYLSGDTIQIEEGSLEIDAVARYLQYNSVSTHLDYSIYDDKSINFEEIDNPIYNVSKYGMDAAQPIQIKALCEGQEITPEQWKEMTVPVVKAYEVEGKEFSEYGDFEVEKSKTPGVYYLYPRLSTSSMSSSIYGDYSYFLSYEDKHGESTWSGKSSGTVSVNDTRTWLERYTQLIIKWFIIAAIVLFILGYIPPFKKYLPKKLKSKPVIDCAPKGAGGKPMTARGKFTKKSITTLIPYKSEEGSIKISPPGLAGIPVMQVKAAGGNMMYLLNTKAYAGKTNITFNGTEIVDGTTKPMHLGAGSMIIIETPVMTYTCIPNQ